MQFQLKHSSAFDIVNGHLKTDRTHHNTQNAQTINISVGHSMMWHLKGNIHLEDMFSLFSIHQIYILKDLKKTRSYLVCFMCTHETISRRSKHNLHQTTYPNDFQQLPPIYKSMVGTVNS